MEVVRPVVVPATSKVGLPGKGVGRGVEGGISTKARPLICSAVTTRSVKAVEVAVFRNAKPAVDSFVATAGFNLVWDSNRPAKYNTYAQIDFH